MDGGKRNDDEDGGVCGKGRTEFRAQLENIKISVVKERETRL